MAKEKTGAAVSATPVKKKKPIIQSAESTLDLHEQCNALIDFNKDRSKQKIQVSEVAFRFFNPVTARKRVYLGVPIVIV